jgi:capsular polysaccharide biosynthesis protein
MNKKKKQYYFELIDVIVFIVRWRKQLIILSSAAAILSIIISSPLVIKPKFKSTAVFYPSTNNSISNALLADSRVTQKDPLEFGEQVAAQQYVQILESDVLKSRVIRQFNLAEHYKIPADDKEINFKVGKLYAKNISTKKTPYASIEVNVLDEDPQMAANIANGVVSILDSVKTEVQKRVALQALAIIENEYKRKEEEVNTIKTRMRELGEKGVYFYEEQSKAITEVMGKVGPNDFVIKQQKALSMYGAESKFLYGTLELQVEQLNELKKKFDQAKIDVDARLSNVFILQTASAAERKTYPIRWMIVVGSIIGTFVMSCIVLLFIEKFREQKDALIA